MSRSRGWAAGALAVAAAAALVVAGALGGWPWSGDDAYGHSLVRYGDEHGEPNRYVNLEDGAAQLSVGSPDGHRIVVQWRDPDGHGWTEPLTVWTDDRNLAIDNTVRYGGGTVAIQQVYTTDVHSEDDTDTVTAAIVCRDRTCTAVGSPGYGSEAQVTPDGQTVLLDQDRRGVHLWTPGDGFRRARWSGHPGFEYGEVSPSRPVLAPDGSLRVVSSRPSRGSCTFELLVSEPGAADLSTVARSTQPLRGRALSDCASYLDTHSADWVTVHPSDHRASDFWFVRRADGAWKTTRDDPSGLEIVDVRRGCCDTAIAGFVHWNDVAYGSPDGRRIQVQTHLLGEETWSDPLLLHGAPRGFACTWLEGYEVGDGFAVLMTCHSGAVRDDFRGDAYAVATTPDLAHWESAWVTGVDSDPVVEGDRVVVGDLVWTTDGGFDRG